MSIENVLIEEAGKRVLLTGNEAVARGAIEAGMKYAASYPGSPSSEVLDVLAKASNKFGLYTEWSTNEKVASEAVAAASFAGLRSMTIMKPDGLNVAIDFLTSLAYSGIKAGMVIVLGDDPSSHSSIKEEDSRYLAKLARLPILEPVNPQEAKDLTIRAFELSEELGLPVVVRCVTRICHASGLVALGSTDKAKAFITAKLTESFVCQPQVHPELEQKIRKAAQWADTNQTLDYWGSKAAQTIVVATGPSALYAKEAVIELRLEESVGVLRLIMSWPVPEQGLLGYLKAAKEIIFAEEIDPFTEENITSMAAYHFEEIGPLQFYGKRNGYVKGPLGPGIGELNTDILMDALAEIKGVNRPEFGGETLASVADVCGELPLRDRAFCAGCPHRASYWAIKNALSLEGNKGFVLGDIGCYAMGRGATGYNLLQTVHSMGSGVGLANGFGTLKEFGFQQPVLAVVGDSTFYHAVIPALINAKHNNADFLCIILDNSTTAMTGHQPHPGSHKDARGFEAPAVSMESLIKGLDIPVKVLDPYEVEDTVKSILEILSEPGPKALILRRECVLLKSKMAPTPIVKVNQQLCLGNQCGCDSLCSRAFNCPANITDPVSGKAIDEALCVGCGVCATLCPAGAISIQEGC
ncbi:MAG: indolepyruvate ferredoxin oxidoreductase subunit alpha [Bacillota bacterium]|nr:indolepyruvate ferredoxin oxidoreductase subunit alpha [Bacillota bacterium]